MSFDGIDGAVTVPNVGGLAVGNASHTVAAWVNVASLPSNRAWILSWAMRGQGRITGSSIARGKRNWASGMERRYLRRWWWGSGRTLR